MTAMPCDNAGCALKHIPTDYEFAGDVMSNFDHEIDEVISKTLHEGPHYSSYTAWEFCGFPWWDCETSKWACVVMRYQEHIDTLVADTLEDIMSKACERWGDG